MIAAPQPAVKRFTLAEFESLPQGPPNFEYDEGEVIPVASPTADHADIVDEINTRSQGSRPHSTS